MGSEAWLGQPQSKANMAGTHGDMLPVVSFIDGDALRLGELIFRSLAVASGECNGLAGSSQQGHSREGDLGLLKDESSWLWISLALVSGLLGKGPGRGWS
jgi:hypothetical protein